MHRKTPRFTNSIFMVSNGARVGGVEEREYLDKKKMYVIVVGGELLSVEELRRRDRRFAAR